MAAGIRARVEQNIKASLEDPEIRQLVAFRRAEDSGIATPLLLLVLVLALAAAWAVWYGPHRMGQ